MSTRTETPTARPAVDGVKGARILIVESRFYADIADALGSPARARIKNAARVGRSSCGRWVRAIAAAGAAAASALGCVSRRCTLCRGESARGRWSLCPRKLAIGYGIVAVDTADQTRARA
jgi:6,7-dimethyl-8-ribityllumazine synthase